MPKLSDTQRILLAHAAKHDDGSFYPLPPSLIEDGAPASRVLKAILQLLKHALAEEGETSVAAAARRTDGDIRYGLFITTAGLAAIGVEQAEGAGMPSPASSSPAPTVKPERVTKTATVLELLKRELGATLAELIEATGWLPHTTRAALTGLRKKGHAVERTKRGEETCYRVAA